MQIQKWKLVECRERSAPVLTHDHDGSPEAAVGDRMKRPPKAPSAEEWRRHRATHVPFRSWCPKCVAGRAVRGDHSEAEAPIDETPQVSMDYCFLRRGADGEASVPVLVAHVRRLGLVFAHVVPHKGGSHREVIAVLMKDLVRCGFNGKII